MSLSDMTTSPQGQNLPQERQDVKIRPTLFIGVGGTGLEVMLRIRRRLLNATWGRDTPLKLESLESFQVAQFLHIDLDQSITIESGKSTATDVLYELVRLKDNDRICRDFDISKYSASDHELDRYPHIKSWSPLTPQKIRELGIDVHKGAGQIRAIARLYFYDQYTTIRDQIRNKIKALRNNLDSVDRMRSMGLEIQTGQFRVIVICSIAGGTGGGCFLDMGWLADWITRSEVGGADVELMLFLPTGYAHANKTRTEANGYAALMELETCMQGEQDYVGQWDLHDNPNLAQFPYKEIYLVDSSNVSNQATGDQKDIYEMVADALFEDFLSSDFATRKRSVAVNQQQHKLNRFNPPVARGTFGDTKLGYSRVYSAIGQSVLDTQLDVRRNETIYIWAQEMLKAFFGVMEQAVANQATTKDRDWVLTHLMHLVEITFREIPGYLKKARFSPILDYELTEKLLLDQDGNPIIAPIRDRVTLTLSKVKLEHPDFQGWPDHIQAVVLPKLEQDVIKGVNAQSANVQDLIHHRRKELKAEITQSLRETFYGYLDNRDLGGIEFVMQLTRQIQARLTSPDHGIMAELRACVEQYEAVKSRAREELDRRLEDLRRIGTGLMGKLLNDPRTKAELVLDNLGTEIQDYLRFHLRAKAAEEASELLGELNNYLGEQQGIDEGGHAIWTGLMGEFMAGREAVLDLLAMNQQAMEQMRQEMSQEHATYIRVAPPERFLNTSVVQSATEGEFREWAAEAFEDYGGSEKIFRALRDRKQRRAMFYQIYAHACRRVPMPSPDDQVDPLLEALKGMSPRERERVFSKWLRLAMPWVNANFAGDFKPAPDQYKIFIGVANSQEFATFKDAMVAQLPSESAVTITDESFVDTGITGRAVCYVELSGMPLYSLRGLDTWKPSYYQEDGNIPVHTHRDTTRFIHPRLTTGDLTNLAENFKLYLLAVVLGVLERTPGGKKETDHSGLYRFEFDAGDKRSIGNERGIRLNGLTPHYRDHIRNKAYEPVLDALQNAALAVIFLHYARYCYKPPVRSDQTGVESEVQGFASAMAQRMFEQYRERAIEQGLNWQAVSEALSRSIDKWSEIVPDSISDAYPWEIDVNGAKPKRRVAPDFFKGAQWLQTLGGGPASEIKTSNDVTAAGMVHVVCPEPNGPPPFPPSFPPRGGGPFENRHYYLRLAGQQTGPFPYAHVMAWISQGQLAPTTLVWRDGMDQWQPLAQIQELISALPVSGSTPPPLPPED